MPHDNQAYADLQRARDSWLGKFECHLRQSAVAAIAKHSHFRTNGVIGRLDYERFQAAITEAVTALSQGKIDPATTPSGYNTINLPKCNADSRPGHDRNEPFEFQANKSSPSPPLPRQDAAGHAASAVPDASAAQ